MGWERTVMASLAKVLGHIGSRRIWRCDIKPASHGLDTGHGVAFVARTNHCVHVH
jgi:hypothetical protein